MMKNWWKQAVVYQIYPRSFQDSNGDGIGDIQGIIQRLPYLSKLGIDAIWLSPVYQSPNYDNGYDISDYQAINPEYGTMEDMMALIHEAHQLGIRLIMDLVVNHTSFEHKWFQEALKGKENPYHDYYVWRHTDNGEVPNELQSVFGGSAWEYVPNLDEYYLHLFTKEQPDLNWDNPALRQEIYTMMNFWLDLGIDGFRMDVIDLIGKQPDEGVIANGPMLHPYLKEMNVYTLQGRDVMTVGETWGATPDIAKQFSGEAEEELSMVFQFETMELDQEKEKDKWHLAPLNFVELKHIMDKWQTELSDDGWNSLFWNNHDLPRIVSRFGDEKQREKTAKLLATMLHMQKGTPYIYQGEELGLTNTPVNSIDEINDIESLNFYHAHVEEWGKERCLAAINAKGRDNARRPIPWDENGGFTTGEPWLSLNPHFNKINAKQALADPHSIFYYYQKLIRLRHDYPIIVEGDFEDLLPNHPSLYIYKRSYHGECWLVACNFSDEVVHTGIDIPVCDILISNDEQSTCNTQVLNPYEAVVYRCE